MIGEWIKLRSFSDSRGTLVPMEAMVDIPIDVKRVFFMHHVTGSRGGHAHIDADQVIVPVSGTFKIDLFDGVNRETYILDDNTRALFVRHLVFIDLYDFSDDAVCLVMTNTHYDISRSLQSVDEYKEYLSNH